ENPPCAVPTGQCRLPLLPTPPCVLLHRPMLHYCARRKWVRGSLPIDTEGDGQMAAENRVAIVTGAASGIGRAMTLGLLEGGIDVAAVDKETAWLDDLASLTRPTGLRRRVKNTSRRSHRPCVVRDRGVPGARRLRAKRHPGQQRGYRPGFD